MVIACMASTGRQKRHVPPISGGKLEYSCGAATKNSGDLRPKIFALPVFNSLFHPCLPPDDGHYDIPASLRMIASYRKFLSTAITTCLNALWEIKAGVLLYIQ